MPLEETCRLFDLDLFSGSPLINHLLELVRLALPPHVYTPRGRTVQTGVIHRPSLTKVDQLATKIVTLVYISDQDTQGVKVLKVGVHLRDL